MFKYNYSYPNNLKRGYLFRNGEPLICPWSPDESPCGSWCPYFDIYKDDELVPRKDDEPLILKSRTVAVITCSERKEFFCEWEEEKIKCPT